MKRFLCTAAAIMALIIPASADEGMWLLPLLQKMNGQAMADLGCRLTPEQIYSINNSSIKDAIVQFGGGCTGEIISDQGLLVTNHHCGYGSIQKLSTPEHNYLENGFWAMNRSQEIPVPGLTVKFLQRMDDITAVMEGAFKTAARQYKDSTNCFELCIKAQNDKAREIEKKAQDADPTITARVTSYYNNNVFYLITYKIYRDVRFVGAPPASCGKFGGETDNWMWPRHTCDFSMFRVYAGKDNQPADYAEDNIPFTPRQALKVSLKGVQDGDFAMIMGYPGSTQRFQTAAQLKQMVDVNDIRIEARTKRQEVMWDAMMADPAVRLQYASKYAGSANGWKKWIGMKKAFADLDIIGREEQKEAEFSAWIDAKKKRQAAYGSAIADIEKVVEATDASRKASTLLTETIANIECVMFSRTGDMNSYRDYDAALDRKIASVMVGLYLDRVQPEDKIRIPGWDLTKANAEDYLDYLFANTVYTSAEKLAAAKKDGRNLKEDPAAQLFTAMVQSLAGPRAQQEEVAELYAKASKAFTAGQLEWKKGEPSYPDANLTCRLSYGTVKAYSPKDGVLYRHYTTLKGVMEKEDPDNYEFIVPAKLKTIFETADYGDYANEKGELVTCFLTNNDITGGNSGSPVLNADGELIGLAFDGNWESMSSDVMFEPDLQRCICVDIRYVLLLMDKFGGAGYLRDEMNIVK